MQHRGNRLPQRERVGIPVDEGWLPGMSTTDVCPFSTLSARTRSRQSLNVKDIRRGLERAQSVVRSHPMRELGRGRSGLFRSSCYVTRGRAGFRQAGGKKPGPGNGKCHDRASPVGGALLLCLTSGSARAMWVRRVGAHLAVGSPPGTVRAPLDAYGSTSDNTERAEISEANLWSLLDQKPGGTYNTGDSRSFRPRCADCPDWTAWSIAVLEMRRGDVAGLEACDSSSDLGHEESVLQPESGLLDLRSRKPEFHLRQ